MSETLIQHHKRIIKEQQKEIDRLNRIMPQVCGTCKWNYYHEDNNLCAEQDTADSCCVNGQWELKE